MPSPVVGVLLDSSPIDQRHEGPTQITLALAGEDERLDDDLPRPLGEPIGEERGKTCPDASYIHLGRKPPYVPDQVDELGAGVAWAVGRDRHLVSAARQRSH